MRRVCLLKAMWINQWLGRQRGSDAMLALKNDMGEQRQPECCEV